MEHVKNLFKEAVKSSGAKISKTWCEESEMINDDGKMLKGTKISVSVSCSKIYDDEVIHQWCKDNGYICSVGGTARTVIYSIFIEDVDNSDVNSDDNEVITDRIDILREVKDCVKDVCGDNVLYYDYSDENTIKVLVDGECEFDESTIQDEINSWGNIPVRYKSTYYLNGVYHLFFKVVTK